MVCPSLRTILFTVDRPDDFLELRKVIGVYVASGVPTPPRQGAFERKTVVFETLGYPSGAFAIAVAHDSAGDQLQQFVGKVAQVVGFLRVHSHSLFARIPQRHISRCHIIADEFDCVVESFLVLYS